MEYIGFFSGGGIKGLAFVGAIIALERRGFFCKRAAGTSAGAIIASLLASGYHSMELYDIAINTDFQSLIKNNSFIQSIKNMGKVSSNLLEQYLSNLYLKKNVRIYRDLYFINDYKLKVVTTNVLKMSKIVLPDDLIEYNINPNFFPVAKSVVMSCLIPFYFEPLKLNSTIIVDGGLVENLPNVSFNETLPKFYFGFKEKVNVDGEYIYISIPKTKSTNFTLSNDKKVELIRCGYESTMKFINKYFNKN